ncbi:MAG: hypothetical protein WBO44_09035 [Saprospiraceae bacterium]
MQSKYHLSDGTQIIIYTNFIGEGGEGGVYQITSPTKFKSSVAKILLSSKRTEIERRYKVDYMIKNPPAETKDQNGHSYLIWPEHILFENNQFVGFLMPRADGVMLEELSSTELGFYPYPRHNDKLGQEWQRFDRNNPDSLVLRLKLCSNIAKAILTLHSTGHYVIGDLKPQNILVQPNGLVSILDLDSCQITQNGNVRFESKMNTPEFNPPENPGRKKEISWDLFILGLIFYKVLNGIHPFFGTCKNPYQNCTLPELKIKEGLFPFGKKAQFFEVIPIGHNTFKDLPEFVQKLFINCFDDGVTNPHFRPTTFDWINKLTAKPFIKFFRPDKKVVFDTQSVNLNWESENGRGAEIVGHGIVEANGRITIPSPAKGNYRLIVKNEFGETEEETFLTRFPTPVMESLKIPTPDFDLRVNLNPITISSPNINTSINLERDKLVQIPTAFIKLDKEIMEVEPLLKRNSNFWSISYVFNKIKGEIIGKP